MSELLQEMSGLDKNNKDLTMHDLLSAIDKGMFDSEENLQKIGHELTKSHLADDFKNVVSKAKKEKFVNSSRYFDRSTADGMFIGDKMISAAGGMFQGLIEHVLFSNTKKTHTEARQATKVDVLYERYVERSKQIIAEPYLPESKAEGELLKWIRKRDPVGLMDKIASLDVVHKRHEYALKKAYIHRDILLYALQRYESEVELDLLKYRREMGYTSEEELLAHAQIYNDYMTMRTDKMRLFGEKKKSIINEVEKNIGLMEVFGGYFNGSFWLIFINGG